MVDLTPEKARIFRITHIQNVPWILRNGLHCKSSPLQDPGFVQIDGFESPLGMELLATTDWLLTHGVPATVSGVRTGLAEWPSGAGTAQRKSKLFDERLLSIALERLQALSEPAPTTRNVTP